MKRIISLLLTVLFLLSVTACTPDNVIPSDTPETDIPKTETQMSADTPEPEPEKTGDETQDTEPTLVYIDSKKAQNTDIKPTLDIDTLGIAPVKVSDLAGKTLTFFTSERNAFSAGELDEKEWFDKVSEQYDLNLKYTVRSDSTLYHAQMLAQKSGMQLDLVTTLISNIAPSRSMMKSALELTGEQAALPFSKRVYALSGNTVFSGVGNSKMMWYNTDIVDDASAYGLFEKGEWTFDALSKIQTDKNMMECGNWAAFGSAGGVQATGLTEDRLLTLTLDNDVTRETFKGFAQVFDTVSKEKETFANGSTAFSFTDKPALNSGTLSYVPIPAYGENGKCITELSGIGMGVSKTADEISSQYAVTFALLWSARYSEWREDFLVYDCALTPQKADKYIEFCETNGGLYNADSEIASVFNTNKISDKLYATADEITATFADAYKRTELLNNRIQ